jgi:hypothetical protein
MLPHEKTIYQYPPIEHSTPRQRSGAQPFNPHLTGNSPIRPFTGSELPSYSNPSAFLGDGATPTPPEELKALKRGSSEIGEEFEL